MHHSSVHFFHGDFSAKVRETHHPEPPQRILTRATAPIGLNDETAAWREAVELIQKAHQEGGVQVTRAELEPASNSS